MKRKDTKEAKGHRKNTCIFAPWFPLRLCVKKLDVEP
jgi:hypothetical protein